MEDKRRLMRIRQADGRWKYVKRATITDADGRTGVYFEDEPIAFADEYVKQKLLANGIGGDGEITYLQAFNCKALPRIYDEVAGKTYGFFEGDTNIRSFDEIRYFGIESVGYETFSGATNLESIVLDGRIVSVQRSAYANTNAVTSLRIGHRVRDIVGNAFLRSSGNYSNLSVTVDERNPYVKYKGANGELYGNDEQGRKNRLFVILGQLPASYELARGIEELNASIFYGQKKLTTFTFEKGSALRTIGDSVWATSGNIANVLEIPEGVTSIGSGICYNGPRRVSLPSTLESLGTNCWGYYSSPIFLEVRGENRKFRMVDGLLCECRVEGDESIPFRAVSGIEDGMEYAHVLPPTLTAVDTYCFTCMPSFGSLTVDADNDLHMGIINRSFGGFAAGTLVIGNMSDEELALLNWIGVFSKIGDIVFDMKEGATLTRYEIAALDADTKYLVDKEKGELLYVFSQQATVDLSSLGAGIATFGSVKVRDGEPIGRNKKAYDGFDGIISQGCPNVTHLHFPPHAGYDWYYQLYALAGSKSGIHLRLRYINVTSRFLDDLYDGAGGGSFSKFNMTSLGIDGSQLNGFADDFLAVARAWYGGGRTHSITFALHRNLYNKLNATTVIVEGVTMTYLTAFGNHGITLTLA